MVNFVFYDFEVTSHDWLVCFKSHRHKDTFHIHNDVEQLKSVVERYKHDIWVGFNNSHYDQWILTGILNGYNPKVITDKIINEGCNGAMLNIGKSPVVQYDCYTRGMSGLKTLESYLGMDIRETTVPFDLKTPWTKEQLDEMIYYCSHDVKATEEVFYNTLDEFRAKLNLIKTFDLPIKYLSKTSAQLTAEIIGCERKKHLDDDEFTILECIDVGKYKDVRKWFESKEFLTKGSKFKTVVGDVPTVYGIGGVHGCIDKVIDISSNEDYLLIHVDVASFYPRLMIFHNLLTRNSTTSEKYKEVFDTRLKLKAEGKKAEQAPYKIVLNSTYGICKDKYSKAYDVRRANEICINGQLMLTDLIDKLDGHCELIQSNTDGLILKVEREKYDDILKICGEWEQRCNMVLEYEPIKRLIQKDVNNYICLFEDGKVDVKGSQVKQKTVLDNDLPIANKAMFEYLVHDIPVEDTVNNCDDLSQFCQTFKRTSKYKSIIVDGQERTEIKVVRVVASKNKNRSMIYKCKDGYKPAKFADCPAHCEVILRDIRGVKIPSWLDRDFYIELIKRRLKKWKN